MFRKLLTLLVLTIIVTVVIAAPPVRQIGRGTKINYEVGNRRLVVVVLGHEDSHTAWIMHRDGRSILVCVAEGDRPPYSQFYLLGRDEVRSKDIVRLVPGKTTSFRPSLSLNKEPPR
jgi:hypothetical protein